MYESNAEKLQSVITDDLFPTVQHVSDVKQVLEEMRRNSQELQEWQIRGLILLTEMGKNTYLHGDQDPYEALREFIRNAKVDVANPEYYIETIEALIPKPPRPVVLAERAGGGRR